LQTIKDDYLTIVKFYS